MTQLFWKILIFAALSATISFGQVNLLINSGSLKHFCSSDIVESNNSIYLTRNFIGKKDSTYNLYPFAYVLEKYNADCSVKLQTQLIAGDTTQTDSTVDPSSLRYFNIDNKILLFYTKTVVRDTPLSQYQQALFCLYTQILDTNLNVLVPEKKILSDSGNHGYAGLNLQNVEVINSSIIAIYHETDTQNVFNYISKFLVFDFSGNVIWQDTVPVKSSSTSGGAFVEEVHQMSNKRVLFTGKSLFSLQYGGPYSYVLTDSNFNVIDTFAENPVYYNSSTVIGGYYPADFNIVPLPGNNLIGGREFEYQSPSFPGQGHTYTALCKLTATSRYSFDSLKIFDAVDANDYSHSSWSCIHSLSYNKNNSRVYFANATHADWTGCTGTYNYLQIISADTNLQHDWRKYIYSGSDYCMNPGFVVACSSQPGVWVSGINRSISNPGNISAQDGFLYRIDSNTNVGVDDPHASIIIRDRIVTYPNPAKDMLCINDLFNQLSEAYLFSFDGRLVKRAEGNSSTLTIPIGNLPSGYYMVRIESTSGEWYTRKIEKE